MKLSILQENLAKAVTLASRFASTRSQLPILGNILLTATKTKLNISSTNLEISVSAKIGAKIEEEGEISVPAKVLSELVGNLPKELIEIESDKEQLKIKTVGFSSNLLGMNSSDFPKIPSSLDKEKSFLVSKTQLIEALPKALFSAGVDETRPILTGVLFVIQKNCLVLVATDGFRLSKKKIDIKSTKESSVVIPKGVLNELLRISGESDDISFEIDEKNKQVVFGNENVVLTSRLLEGEYPDFEKIIPKNSSISIRLDKEEFLRAVKLASIFARESANIVKIKLAKDFVNVLAESGNSGSQETKVDAKISGYSEIDSGSASKFEVAFNYRFLEEFLHSVSGEEVLIEFTTTDKAGVFKDSSDPNFLHLIMPVKIQG
jgi:DNA polymerase III subunit beta